ncbi:MAG TPA: cell division protein FtsL [Gammaproteobacteria bacterium]|nr:cell division protein FtsL [Gammaproteobacteria bacterium]
MRLAILEIMLAVVLLGGIVSTGMALVSTTHESRRLFREVELLRREQDRLRDEWSALTLEVSHLAGHARIDEIARDELGLVEPDAGRLYVEVAP